MSPPDPEIALAEALSAYERSYYKKVSSALDYDAEQAKRIVKQARTFIQDSRLAYAICRSVLEHVKYWPSWSERPDFHEYANGPFRYLDGKRDTGASPETTVKFSYNSEIYTLRFFDEGISPGATDDMHTYGKVELIIDDQTVLGLDISKDLQEEFAHWWMVNVYPGPWMKELIEMAAYIDGTEARKREDWRNDDALKRAKAIRLP